MRSSKNKNPCFDCLASEKENEEVCKTIRAMLNKSNSVQVEMKDPGSIGTLTIRKMFAVNLWNGLKWMLILTAIILRYSFQMLNAKIGVELIALAYLSFLVATNGYDKVIQAIKQIKQIGNQ